jgi:hypothetical protein
VLPVNLGLFPGAEPGVPANTWALLHSFNVNVTANCTMPAASGSGGSGGSPWGCQVGSSAPGSTAAQGRNAITSRFLVQRLADVLAAVAAYGAHNGMQEYPSIMSKLGYYNASKPAAQALTEQTFASPLLKLDAVQAGIPISSYPTAVYPPLPVPSIVHYCSFEVGGFDHNYPDFLPPAPQWNVSSCGLAEVMAAATARGLLTMCYTNPTWWSTTSPTLTHLPPNVTLASGVAALNASLEPVYETYGPNSGVAVSLAPFVQARLATLLAQFSPKISTPPPPSMCNDSNVVLPNTFVFEDQIGARPPITDYSSAAAGGGQMAYAASWQAHMDRYAAAGLQTEQGFDRLGRWATAFHGTVLVNIDATPAWWGTGNWALLPAAAALLKPLTLLFQHNLDQSHFAFNISNTCWSIATGYHLSFNIGLPYDPAWLAAAGLWQRVVMSRFAQLPLVAFTPSASITAGVSAALFSGAALPQGGQTNYSVTGNWDVAYPVNVSVAYGNAAAAGVFTLPPSGCAVVGVAPVVDVIAGFFTVYNGAALAGDVPWHVIIEDRQCSTLGPGPGGAPTVCVYHPLGTDTSVTVALPAALNAPGVTVTAVTSAGVPIADVPSQLGAGGLLAFLWAASVSGSTVDAYVVH